MINHQLDEERRQLLIRQAGLITSLGKRAKEFSNQKEPRPKRIEKLRSFLADSRNNLLSMAPLPLPLNGNIEVVGIIPEKASIFKSNLSPLLLYFSCSDGSEYPIIFKDGDDMRQDQLVIQLFTLMDRLLRQENLDVKLTPYPVLATGPQQGMMQYVPSQTIANIVSENGTILNYMRAHHPDEGSVGTYGVDPGVIDTFVRSCGKPEARVRASNVLHFVLFCISAGYCVVTYLLGVGDRHLDNLLVAPDGAYQFYFLIHVGLCFDLSHQAISSMLTLATYLDMIRSSTHLPSKFARRWLTEWAACTRSTMRGSQISVLPHSVFFDRVQISSSIS
jgi:phosphatidylinositol 3-kinase